MEGKETTYARPLTPNDDNCYFVASPVFTFSVPSLLIIGIPLYSCQEPIIPCIGWDGIREEWISREETNADTIFRDSTYCRRCVRTVSGLPEVPEILMCLLE